MFEQWVEKQANEQAVNDVYILLVKQPAHLQVIVGNQTLKQAFTTADREALVGTMLVKLRARQNDAALLEGVNFVSSAMHAHSGAASRTAPVQRSEARPATNESSSGWVLPVLIGLVGMGRLRTRSLAVRRQGCGQHGNAAGFRRRIFPRPDRRHVRRRRGDVDVRPVLRFAWKCVVVEPK